MKFTIAFVAILSISATWAIKAKVEDKDKREAAVSYGSPHQHSSQAYNFQASPQGNEEASAISIGAGYSVGGGKPSYSFANQISGAAYQVPSEGLPASGHGAIQLAPITLQAAQGGLVSNDLSQLMSQLQQGLNSGAYTFQAPSGHGAYQFEGQSQHGGQEVAIPQFAYSAPNTQQYTLGEQAQPAAPSYATGTKGLGSYSSTGPVLFSPDSQSNQGAQNYASSSYASEGAPISYANPGQVSGYSVGNAGNPFGGSYKAYAANYAPGKSHFKPSAFLGSVQSEGGHAASFAAPSFGNYQSGGLSFASGGHGPSFGSLSGHGHSPKYVTQHYLPAKSAEGLSSESHAPAFSVSGQLGHGQQGSSHGFPSSAYSSHSHSAPAHSPQYYVPSKHASSGGFGSGSSSYKSPGSSHSLNSFTSGPKYSFGGQSSRYLPPKDSHGAFSEYTYNTIKYSEELKPHNH